MIRNGSFSVNGTRNFFIAIIFLPLLLIGHNLWTSISLGKTQSLTSSHPQVKQELSYFIEEGAVDSPRNALRQLDKFIIAEQDDIPFDLEDKTYWVRAHLTNTSAEDIKLSLHLDNSMLAEFVTYKLNERYQVSEVFNQGNDKHSLLFPHVNLTLGANDDIQLLIKIDTYGPPNVPIGFYEQSYFEEKSLFTKMFYGCFIGVILVMAMYNIVLFAAIKDKVYLTYVAYLLVSFVALGSVIGFGYLVYPPEIQQFLNRHTLFFHYYLVFFLVLFSLFFLRYDTMKSRMYWVGVVFCTALALLSFTTFFMPHAQQARIFFSLQPVFHIISLILILNRLTQSFAWARFYFISWIPLLVGGAVQPLVSLNYLDYSFLTRNAFMLGVLVEVVFMAFALAERMRRFEIERLREISYHPVTAIPRRILLERSIAELVAEKTKRFSVLVIEPEQIDRVSLYGSKTDNTELFKRMHTKLTTLFNYNDAVVTIGHKSEKIALLANRRFAILVDHQYSQQSLNLLIKSIQQLVEEAYQLNDLKIPLSAVIGVANYPEDGETDIELLNKAQLAINSALHVHQKWSYFEADSSENSEQYLTLASQMRQAIEFNDFELYHQPQIDLKTMNVCGSEVLLRWHHSEQGFIPPDVFIPIAEDMGLINKLTHWVVKQAIIQHKQLIDNGYNHMISINISGKDVAADDFYDFVVETLTLCELSPNKVALELTESATVSNNKQAMQTIERLSSLGLTISLDDFGTGYSSMAYISELPFQELKVDRQFVENVCDDDKQKIIAETTVKMAKGLGLEVVAEGINSQLDEDTLRSFGCDIGQGYYYAKPMTLNDYIDWLANESNGRVTGFKSQSEQAVIEGDFIPAQEAVN